MNHNDPRLAAVLGGDFFRDRRERYAELQRTGAEGKKEPVRYHMEESVSLLAGRRETKIHTDGF